MTNQLPEKTTGRKAAKFRGPECLNCGNPLELSDIYCSYCGQLNTTKSLALKDFFGEFIGSIITYDSRFRHTLKDLLFRPGTITRNYVGGKRLMYANPFRFFLSVSIIYFLLSGIITSISGNDNRFRSNGNGPNFEMGPTGDNFKIFTTPTNAVSYDSVLRAKGIPVDSILGLENIPNQKEVDSLIRKFNPIVKKNDTVQSYDYISEEHLDTLHWLPRSLTRFELYVDFYKTTNIKDPSKALDSLKHNNTKYNRWIYDKNKAIEQVKENPTDFLNYLMEKTPFFVFFFTPFYALFFWLIYSKKKYTYMEHMILIFHIFSFIFLAMLIVLVPDLLIGGDILGRILFGIIGPFYFYKALRNFYKQNRLITIIKFIFLNIVFGVSATISGLIFFAITAAMY
jgi:Protein of unknown function (DUF3667)